MPKSKEGGSVRIFALYDILKSLCNESCFKAFVLAMHFLASLPACLEGFQLGCFPTSCGRKSANNAY
jgi:hypothetical protein